MGIRYLLQIIVMAADLAIPLAGIYIVCSEPTNPFFWLISLFAFKVWMGDGLWPLEAWRWSTIRKFLKNAKRFGL
jgi:hypothetical protein